MKRLFSIFVLFVLLANLSVINGQTRYLRRPVSKFGYGVKGGANLAWQSSPDNDGSVKVNEIIGVNAGGYCNYFYTRKLGIQGELLVSAKGSNWKDFYDHMKDVATYIDVPLLARYQPHKYFSFHLGPVLSYRLNSTRKDLGQNVQSEIKDLYKPVEVSVTAGAEVNLPFHINVTLRYIYGLTPATKDEVGSWYNNLIQMSIGYRIKGR